MVRRDGEIADHDRDRYRTEGCDTVSADRDVLEAGGPDAVCWIWRRVRFETSRGPEE